MRDRPVSPTAVPGLGQQDQNENVYQFFRAGQYRQMLPRLTAGHLAAPGSTSTTVLYHQDGPIPRTLTCVLCNLHHRCAERTHEDAHAGFPIIAINAISEFLVWYVGVQQGAEEKTSRTHGGA